MSTTESAVRAPVQATSPDTSLIPGEETSWEKFAPNGEPVVSGVASFTIHAIALGVVLMGLVMLFRESSAETDIQGPPLILMPDGQDGGGKGHKDASSIDPGVPPAAQDSPPMPLTPKTPPSIDAPTGPNDGRIAIGPSKPEEKPFIDVDPATRWMNPRTAELRKRLEQAFSTRSGQGMKGPGTDGGGGGGDGGGNGKEKGTGTGPNPTARRFARWELVFPQGDALHYLQQLEALGAIVAVTDEQNHVMTIRNLRERPAKPIYEIITDPDRIYWVDDRKDSTETVAEELELSFVPGAIVAFFPKSLEDELLKKELAFRGRAEIEIKRTRFTISFHGGQHVIRVVDQEGKTGRAGK